MTTPTATSPASAGQEQLLTFTPIFDQLCRDIGGLLRQQRVNARIDPTDPLGSTPRTETPSDLDGDE